VEKNEAKSFENEMHIPEVHLLWGESGITNLTFGKQLSFDSPNRPKRSPLLANVQREIPRFPLGRGGGAGGREGPGGTPEDLHEEDEVVDVLVEGLLGLGVEEEVAGDEFEHNARQAPEVDRRPHLRVPQDHLPTEALRADASTQSPMGWRDGP